jgi:hypothetical protein
MNLDRFDRAAAALLARLALAPRAHPREELVELLWPGVALTSAATGCARCCPRCAAARTDRAAGR